MCAESSAVFRLGQIFSVKIFSPPPPPPFVTIFCNNETYDLSQRFTFLRTKSVKKKQINKCMAEI